MPFDGTIFRRLILNPISGPLAAIIEDLAKGLTTARQSIPDVDQQAILDAVSGNPGDNQVLKWAAQTMRLRWADDEEGAGQGENNVQPDWDVDDVASDAFIQNKPNVLTIEDAAGIEQASVDVTFDDPNWKSVAGAAIPGNHNWIYLTFAHPDFPALYQVDASQWRGLLETAFGVPPAAGSRLQLGAINGFWQGVGLKLWIGKGPAQALLVGWDGGRAGQLAANVRVITSRLLLGQGAPFVVATVTFADDVWYPIGSVPIPAAAEWLRIVSMHDAFPGSWSVNGAQWRASPVRVAGEEVETSVDLGGVQGFWRGVGLKLHFGRTMNNLPLIGYGVPGVNIPTAFYPASGPATIEVHIDT